MSGGGSQNSLRKALGAIKDSTTLNLAKVNNEYKELDVNIVKATNHTECPAKEKHMQAIFSAISNTRPRANVLYCIYALERRISKTHNWAVALKTLIVIHRAIREVNPTFQEVLLNHKTDSLLNLSHFKDDSSSDAFTWVQAYALYLKMRLECFSVLKYDIVNEHSRTGDLDINELFQQLPAFQQLMSSILFCQPKGAAERNLVIRHAFSMVASESVKVFKAVIDATSNLADKFFEMERSDALISLDMYRRSALQASFVTEFYEKCKLIDIGPGDWFIKTELPSFSFIQVMEEYIGKAPCASTIRKDPPSEGKPNVMLAIEHKKVETQLAEPLKDLLNLNDPVQEVSEIDKQKATAMGMAIVPISGQPVDLLTGPSSNESATYSTKLAGGLDQLTLASLYDDAVRRTKQTMSYNPWEQHVPMTGSMMPPQTVPYPFYAFNIMDAPQTAPYPLYAFNMMDAPHNVHMATMAQQQRQHHTMMMNPSSSSSTSSSSSSSRLIANHEREALVEEHSRIRCKCNVFAKCWTSWTSDNPGRRFVECPNYSDPTRNCKFFDWVDPELPNERYKSRMYDMYMELKTVKSEDNELNFYKNANGTDKELFETLAGVMVLMILLFFVLVKIYGGKF